MNPALELLNLLEELDGEGTTVIDLVRGGRPLVPWRLYPNDDGIFDRRTHCQFYYHSHGADHEAGHFHTVRLFADHTVHLVAISIAANGWPQALFTLNLWAIGDAYETAANLRRYVRAFRVADHAGPNPLVRFINLMYQAFGREMERLQEEKIERLLCYRVANPGRDIFKDRSLEILSRVEIDVRAAAKNRNATVSCGAGGEGRA
jgi:uncharacterized protein DUF6969